MSASESDENLNEETGPEETGPPVGGGDVLFRKGTEFKLGVVALTGLPEADRSEVAFAGRSNVGKSSLINGLTRRRNLARSSNTPGRTREVNYFDLANGTLWLVDLPGYGYAKAPNEIIKRWTQLTKQYLTGRATLRRVYLLIDSRHGLKESDSDYMKMLTESAVSFQIVLTKADKISKSELQAVTAKTEKAIIKVPAAHPVVLVTSAEKGLGLDQLRDEIAALV